MFTAKQYRDKAAEYQGRTATAITREEKREYQDLEQRFTPSRTTSSGYLTITIRRCTHLSRFHIFHHQLGNSKSYRLWVG